MKKKIDKFVYPAKLLRVVDGDTCDAMIDLGFDIHVKKRIRFMGIDTWESRTRDKEEKKKGLAAKEFTNKMLSDSDDGKFLIKSFGVGKYGRVLGEIFIKGHDVSLNELLKENGHASEYYGGKRNRK